MFLVLGEGSPLSGNHTRKCKEGREKLQSPAAGNQMPEASVWAQSLNWGLEAELHPHTALVTSLKAGKFTVQV